MVYQTNAKPYLIEFVYKERTCLFVCLFTYLLIYLLNSEFCIRYKVEDAHFYVFFAITFTILVFLAYWLGQAYLKTVSVQSTYTSIERFIFLGWDYSIEDSLQAVLKQQSNFIALKEVNTIE